MALEQTETMQKVRNAGIVLWTVIGGLILLYVVFSVISQISSVLTPFFLALLLVYVLRPVVNWLEDRGVRRLLALVFTYLGALVVVTVVLFFLIPVLVVQVQEFIRNFPRYFTATSRLFAPYRAYFDRVKVDRNAARLVEAALAKAQETGLLIAERLPSYTLSAFALLLNLVLAPLIAFYLLKDLREIKQTMLEVIPERHRAETVHLIHEIDCVLAGFLRGQSLVALSVAVLSTIALVILRVDYPVVIGLITGLLSVIPYFGPIVGAAIAGIVALFKSPLLALLAVVLLIAIQQVANLFIAPYIMSQQVNVHPVVVIFALLVGGALFGLVGLILAIPVAAVAKAVFMHFMQRTYPGFADDGACEPKPKET